MSCIIGAVMYCTAAMAIPGPLHTQPSYQGNEAWRYATYYGPPVLAGTYIQPAVLPAAFPVLRRT